ncbi:DUF4227 family protein [Salicibibacter halophilus]|nr:DUF4227 family protein [Salicibibacter halophilus]
MSGHILVLDFKIGGNGMQVGIRAIWNGFKILIIFAGCTAMFYYGILFVIDEYQGDERFEEPEGNAIKVFDQDSGDDFSFRERLLHLWLHGE